MGEHDLLEVGLAARLAGGGARLGEDGKIIAAKMAMMAITTNSSIRVKPLCLFTTVSS